MLDVGAGAGRVALDLARAGHDVTALDLDAELLAELSARAAAEGLAVRTEQADAAGFQLSGAPFGLIVVPMQTIQLLPGRAARARRSSPRRASTSPPAGWWRSRWPRTSSRSRSRSRRHCRPTRAERDGWHYRSFPVAVRRRGDSVVLERVRVLTAPDGTTLQRGRHGHFERPSARPTSRPRGAPPASSPEPAHHIEETEAPPRLDGGDAAWLTASCGSARCTRTS